MRRFSRFYLLKYTYACVIVSLFHRGTLANFLTYMKKEIHPTYYPDATVTCACGSDFTIGSTVEELEVEMCSDCHPFYTGVEKTVDTAGRIDKFRARQEKAEEKAAAESEEDSEEDESQNDEAEENDAEEDDDFEKAKKELEKEEN